MKHIFTCILVGLLTQICSAQYLDYGFRGSLGYTNLSNSGAGFGLNAGITTKMDLKDQFGIGADVLFGFKTGFGSRDDNGTTVDVSHFAGSIDIPVYLYAPFSEHLIIEAGLNFGSSLGDPFGSESRSGNSTDLDNLTFEPSMGYIFGLKVQTSQDVSFGLRYLSTSDGGSIGETSSVQATFSYLINW